jgi:hypothetical protein
LVDSFGPEEAHALQVLFASVTAKLPLRVGGEMPFVATSVAPDGAVGCISADVGEQIDRQQILETLQRVSASDGGLWYSGDGTPKEQMSASESASPQILEAQHAARARQLNCDTFASNVSATSVGTNVLLDRLLQDSFLSNTSSQARPLQGASQPNARVSFDRERLMQGLFDSNKSNGARPDRSLTQPTASGSQRLTHNFFESNKSVRSNQSLSKVSEHTGDTSGSLQSNGDGNTSPRAAAPPAVDAILINNNAAAPSVEPSPVADFLLKPAPRNTPRSSTSGNGQVKGEVNVDEHITDLTDTSRAGTHDSIPTFRSSVSEHSLQPEDEAARARWTDRKAKKKADAEASTKITYGKHICGLYEQNLPKGEIPLEHAAR